jgi:hypothetical protein
MLKKMLFFGIGLLYSGYAMSQGCPIIWQDMVNTSVSGDVLTKTSGGSGWNADARSVQTIPANTDGFIIFEVHANDLSPQFGFNQTNSSASWSDLNFRLFFQFTPTHLSRQVEVNFNGSSTFLSAYNVGDKYRIRRTGSTMYVDKLPNGFTSWQNNLFSASALISGTLPELFADISLFHQGGSIEGATISCENAYAAMKPGLDASFHRCKGGVLNLLVKEDYNHTNSALSLKFYDSENQLVYQPAGLLKSTGLNQYTLDLAVTTYFTQGEYYTAVIEDSKKRKTYLRIQYNE